MQKNPTQWSAGQWCHPSTSHTLSSFADLWVCSSYAGVSHHRLLFLYNIKQLELPAAVRTTINSTALLLWSIDRCSRVRSATADRRPAIWVSTARPMAGDHTVAVFLPFRFPGRAEFLNDSLSVRTLSCSVLSDHFLNIFLNRFILGRGTKRRSITTPSTQ